MTATRVSLLETEIQTQNRKIDLVMLSKHACWVTGVLMGLASWHFGWRPDLCDRSAVLGFAGPVASIAATMLGFMLTAFALLASISNTTLAARMKKTGHYEDLLQTILFGGLLFVAIAFFGFVLLFGAPPHPWILAILLGLHVAAVMSLVDIGHKFSLVLSNLD